MPAAAPGARESTARPPSRSVVCQTTSDNAKGSTCGVESYYEYDMYNII